jgi:hypothetical protein
MLKKKSSLHRPLRNCSDATNFEAISSSDACFHPGAELFRQFDRRSLFSTVGSSYFELWVPSIITVGGCPSLLTLISSNRRLRPYAVVPSTSGDPPRAFASRAPSAVHPCSPPATRAARPRGIRARKGAARPRVWPPPPIPARRHRLGSSAFI